MFMHSSFDKYKNQTRFFFKYFILQEFMQFEKKITIWKWVTFRKRNQIYSIRYLQLSDLVIEV